VIKCHYEERGALSYDTKTIKQVQGPLIQMDATPFEWFGTNEKFALHGAIDDATGKTVGLYLAKNECLQGYFEVICRKILTKYSISASIYADRHSIFLSPNASKLTVEDQLAGGNSFDLI
jgi:hypothetical protein